MKFRSFVAAVALLASAAAWGAAPKYVFYFIGDGMGVNPAMASVMYNRQVNNSDELPLMMTFPHAGVLTTFSASSPVTDSAAAGTALASGVKTKNGMVGMDADTVAVKSLADYFKADGYGVGVVTNVAADDATPASYYGHVPARWMSTEIDKQFADGNVDFLAGSALRGLTDKDGNSTGVLELYKEKNVKYLKGLDELAANKPSKKEKVVLVDAKPFAQGNCGYALDKIEGQLTLCQMTRACLDHLKAISPDRFFMMVEGGNIDHALHANDAASALVEIFNFNDALKIAYDFYLDHPDETLIVVTADHDTGGLTVGNAANGYTAHFDLLGNQKISKEMFQDYCSDLLDGKRQMSWEEMQKYLTENMGFWNQVKLSDTQTDKLRELYEKTFKERQGEAEKTLYKDFNKFASEVFGIMSTNAAVGWTTGSHTGNFVPVYAIGVGSEAFGRVLDNTQVPKLIRN